MPKHLRIIMLFSIASVFVIADVVTKWATITFLRNKPPIVLLPVLDFRYVENHDIAFSLFEWIPDRIRPVVIIVLACLMTVYVLFLFFRYAAQFLLLGFGLTMVLSGAIGNLIDRFTRGFVIDFIHVHYGVHSWPVFNIADICVSTGIGLIALGLFVTPSEPVKEEMETDTEANTETKVSIPTT